MIEISDTRSTFASEDARPWKQQVGEVIGSVAAALAIATVLTLLHKAFGFGSDAIPAPQATLMKVMVEGVMNGGAPWHLIGIILACLVLAGGK